MSAISKNTGLFAKIANFHRLPFNARQKLFWYYFRRMLGAKPKDDKYFLSQYYEHLIELNGRTIEINKNDYLSNYDLLSGSRRLFVRKQPSSDILVFRQIFRDLEYEPLSQLTLDLNSSTDLRIIDAGANVGYATLFMHWRFPLAKIVSVEPENANFEYLVRNLQTNAVSNVTPILGAVWNRDAHLSIANDFRDGKDWSCRVVESATPTEVIGMSITKIMNEQGWDRLDVLKIDIEGSELQLFSDRESIDRVLSKTRLIAIELHDEFDCRELITTGLLENGFSLIERGETLFGYKRT